MLRLFDDKDIILDVNSRSSGILNLWGVILRGRSDHLFDGFIDVWCFSNCWKCIVWKDCLLSWIDRKLRDWRGYNFLDECCIIDGLIVGSKLWYSGIANIWNICRLWLRFVFHTYVACRWNNYLWGYLCWLLNNYWRKLWCNGSNIRLCMSLLLNGLENHIGDAELQLLVLANIFECHINSIIILYLFGREDFNKGNRKRIFRARDRPFTG